eukprot:TRINITY_DN1102_c0_g1_i10.p2 TRINITY_DN1102_c0_g1~~TRINITY_DN1102_c0_g1_i10.p2  ORF type:complete len:257 (+),score=-24.21 TRINITY_DN1102_c0_g1_i10:63-773(+)
MFYLIMVDRYSGFPFVYSFNACPSTNNILKAVLPTFSTFGIPTRCRTDGGPQFKSRLWKETLRTWGSEAVLTSPYHPESNGHAEACVKAIKTLIKKTGNINDHKFLKAILEWRNIPKDHGKSPAELMFNHQIRSSIPTLPINLQTPQTSEDLEWEKIRDRQRDKRDAHFNRSTRPLKEIEEGTSVVVQNRTSMLWDLGAKVVGRVNPRTYKLLLENGKILLRNRRFIKPFRVVRFE